MRRPRTRTVGVALLALVGLLLVVGVWYVQPQPLLPEAEASLASTPTVTFTETDAGLEWAPADGNYDTGLIVYPGGKVPAAAYGPLAAQIAEEGYLVVVTPMPLNLAVLGIGKAGDVIAAHPEVETWAIGGHSLGGSMAAQYASDNPDAIDGLAFWASYAATDLSALDLAVAVDLGLARRGRRADVRPRGAGVRPAGRRVHRDPGWQPRADGLVHGSAQRPAGDHQPGGPAGPGGRGDGRDARATRSGTLSDRAAAAQRLRPASGATGGPRGSASARPSRARCRR